jgi:hypothetical protein
VIESRRMTAEWVAAAASVATFAVIGATAVTALIQLRHVRNSNQITVFTELRHKMEAQDFQEAMRFVRYEVPQRLDDPAFRRRILDRYSSEGRLIRDIGDFLDTAIAPLVKHRMVDRDLACDLFYLPVVMTWDTLAPFIASCRAATGYRMWEDFEYLTLLCKDFRTRFPHGTYPKGAAPLPLPEPWPESYERQKTTL